MSRPRPVAPPAYTGGTERERNRTHSHPRQRDQRPGAAAPAGSGPDSPAPRHRRQLRPAGPGPRRTGRRRAVPANRGTGGPTMNQKTEERVRLLVTKLLALAEELNDLLEASKEDRS